MYSIRSDGGNGLGPVEYKKSASDQALEVVRLRREYQHLMEESTAPLKRQS
jgi:hypothetical protein